MADYFYTVLRCVRCGQHRTPWEAFTKYEGRCFCRGTFVVAHMVLSPVVGRVTDAGNQGTHPAPETQDQPICQTCGQPCVYQGTHP